VTLLATQLGDDHPGVILTSSREVDEGARAALLQVDGLFRVDVGTRDDMVRTVVRNLSPDPLDVHSPGGPLNVEDGVAELTTAERCDLDLTLGGVAVRVLIGTLRDRARGVTRFTAQAVVRASTSSPATARASASAA
jgi:hypothetical protein